jgi:DNA-binding NarL/FixJ family response regulator
MRIFVASNDVLRRGLRDLLGRHPGWFVCGEAKNGKEAVNLTLQLKPDVVILDHDLPEITGVEATRLIKATLPSTEILFFTTHREDRAIADALSAGALGYVLTTDGEDKVIDAVESLGRHSPFLNACASEMLLKHLINKGAQTEEMKLPSEREREIIRLLAEGSTNREVASLLQLSVKTVETHRSAIMQKLKINSIADLVRYAIRHKLIEP